MLYLDASAIVKLVVPEPETPALLAALRGDAERVTSGLSIVEVHRAIARIGARPTVTARADAVLERLALMPVDDAVLRDAARLEPADLRTLDAIHLAAARSLLPDLAGVVTYDRRLGLAATAAGLDVMAPGRAASDRL